MVSFSLFDFLINALASLAAKNVCFATKHSGFCSKTELVQKPKHFLFLSAEGMTAVFSSRYILKKIQVSNVA